MFKELKNLLANSYSPYSNIKVASIVVMKKNKKYYGVNVENASFGATICAERSALVSAISNGEKKEDILELHLTSNAPTLLYSCGICLQVMSEFLTERSKIFIYFQDQVIETNIKKMMPNLVLKENFGWK